MKTTRHGEFMYYSKSHGWQVASVFLAIISWFLCTVFYDNSMYRKRSAHMTERENICTSNLVRHKLILIEEKRTILPTYFSIGREFTLISRMTDIHSQWNSQPETQKDSSSWSIFPSPTVQCSGVFWSDVISMPVSLLWELQRNQFSDHMSRDSFKKETWLKKRKTNLWHLSGLTSIIC